ncbi:MAG: tRNA-binding protein [Porticoccaceae bacterium]|nr:tRNA-binding protein [Porticoccaceae bacterium]
MTKVIQFDDFLNVDIKTGTITEAELSKKARKPAYSMKIDFGENIGIKTTSAQITKEHNLESLVGTQVLAVMNFPEKNIAGVVSQVLVLAVVEDDGRTVLIQPSKKVKNGSRLL